MQRKQYDIIEIILLAGVILLFIIENSRFSYPGLLVLMKQASVLGIMSIGLGFVMVTGNADLSCGALISLGSALCILLVQYHLPAVLSILITIACCGCLGMITGLLTVSAPFSPIIITFAMAMIYSALGNILKTPATIRIQDTNLAFLGKKLLFMPAGFVMFLTLLLFAVFLMQNTYIGKYMAGIGDNEKALERIGIRTKYYKVLAFAMSGVLCGIAGICMAVRISGRLSGANLPMMMQAYTVLSLSGIGFLKFHRSFLFILYGVVVVTLLRYSLTVMNLSADWQNVIFEILFLLSIAIFHFSEKRRQNN